MSFHNNLKVDPLLLATIRNVVEKKNLDPVDKKQVTKSFANRRDKDIDNDGDVDNSDKYLHNRRKAITKAVSKKKDKIVIDPEVRYVNERELSAPEMKKRENIVKSMKKNAASFKKRYGDDWKSVMYGTATKLAKEENEFENSKALINELKVKNSDAAQKLEKEISRLENSMSKLTLIAGKDDSANIKLVGVKKKLAAKKAEYNKIMREENEIAEQSKDSPYKNESNSQKQQIISKALNELSTKMLQRYKDAATQSHRQADGEGNFKKGDKRFKGIIQATKKQFANDIKEQAGSYPMTMLKHQDGVPHIKHITIQHDELKSGNVTPERVRHLVNNHSKVKQLKQQGYSIHKYGEHDKRTHYYGQKVKIEKE